MYPFVLCLAAPGDLEVVRGLVQEAAAWLRTKDTDQWEEPWPDQDGQRERMLNDLIEGKTWIVWDGPAAAATISIDTDEPLDLNDQPVWPAHKRHVPALYVRRVIVSRAYGGIGLGAGLLDWAADVAKRGYGAEVIRIDVWTTNLGLHSYYEGKGFTRLRIRNPRVIDYPSQALFEREIGRPRSNYAEFFTEVSGRA